MRTITKNRERIQKFKEAGDSWYIYQSQLDKAWFQHDMVYGDFRDLTRRSAFDKILRDKAFNIPKNPKYDGYERGHTAMFYKFFDKIFPGSGIKNENISYKELVEELHKRIIWKFKKRKVYTSFIDSISSADLADMQFISKFNKGICFVFCGTDIFSKYTYRLFL